MEPWSLVHMDHTYITGVRSFIITSRLFFKMAWSNPCTRQETFYDKTDSKGHVFLKWQTKILESDNAVEFCDEDLSLWLEKIGCKPCKILPYLPQSIGLAERMVQTVKTGLKACSQQKEKNRSFSTKAAFKLSHNTTHQKTNDVFHKWKNVVQKEQRIKSRKGRIYYAKRPQYS